jgi:hypothetical protein
MEQQPLVPVLVAARSAVARLLRLWVRIPPGAWMSVCWKCCVLSGRGFSDEPTNRPDKYYWLRCVVVCDLETSWMRSPLKGCCPKWNKIPSWPGDSHYGGITITLRHTKLARTPLEEWSARRRDLCLTIHKTHKIQISMSQAGYKHAIPASERQQRHALDQCFSTFGRPRPGEFFFHKTRARSQQIYS